MENITEAERAKYSTPLPHDFIASKDDKSTTYVEVLKLQEEFGFEYASVIGMFIYLLNTCFAGHFAITKLAKFMTLPGLKHFKETRHMLKYLRCNYLRFGVTYYSDVSKSPIYKLIEEFTEQDPKHR